MSVIRVEEDIHYLPKPNRVETIISDSLPPLDMISTAFVIPVTPNGLGVFVNNRRRGIEIPGGHLEKNETAEMAAVREAFEETGCVVANLRPLGHLRMLVYGGKPKDYKYPFPYSFQQFFAGRVVCQTKFEPNDECLAPVFMDLNKENMERLREGNRLFLTNFLNRPKFWGTLFGD